MDDFKPGDMIVRTLGNGAERVRVVLDPVRTQRGKLRLWNPHSGAEITAWWNKGEALPKGWELSRTRRWDFKRGVVNINEQNEGE